MKVNIFTSRKHGRKLETDAAHKTHLGLEKQLHITSQWLIIAENEAWWRGVGAAFGLMKLP